MRKNSDLFLQTHTYQKALSVVVFWGCLLIACLANPQFVAKAMAQDKSGKDNITIVALGDSLTAGYGLTPGHSFPVRLQAALVNRNLNVMIKNAGVSGDTSSGGLERLNWAIPANTNGVILALGANDALRGLPPDLTYKNLDKILGTLQKKHIKVLFVGMEAPRNLGETYGKQFRQVYKKLAHKYGVLFYPFFLKDVALKSKLNQSDGIHPNPNGVDQIVRNILPDVEKLITQIRKSN